MRHFNMAYISEPNWLGKHDINTSLFRVSKQISREALDFFYGENMFMFDLFNDTSEYFVKSLSKNNLPRIKRFKLRFQSGPWHLDIFNSEIWTPFLGQLKTLQVQWLAYEPKVPEEESEEESEELPEEEAWLRFIARIMRFIAERIPPGKCVELNNHSTVQVMKVMQETFTSCVVKERDYEWVTSEEEEQFDWDRSEDESEVEAWDG